MDHHPRSDDEADALWLEAGIPPERIKRFGDEHNWWGPPGASGPCGPNSELYYDAGRRASAAATPRTRPTAIAVATRVLEPGVHAVQPGRERHAHAAAQARTSTPAWVSSAAAVVALRPAVDLRHRPVPADHPGRRADRGCTYAPGRRHRLRPARAGRPRSRHDLPGAGRRRARHRRPRVRAAAHRSVAPIRYGRRLGIDRPFLAEMVDAVVERMAQPLSRAGDRQRARIVQVIANEEELFSRTLQGGHGADRAAHRRGPRRGQTRDPGERAFDLYQTYGFPIELTEEMLREQGLALDRAEFDAALRPSAERAGAARASSTSSTPTTSEFGGPPSRPSSWRGPIAAPSRGILAAVADDGPVPS